MYPKNIYGSIFFGMEATNRDSVESILLSIFPDVLKPLETQHIDVLNRYKDGSFGFSYLGIMLYANGCNEKGRSTKYPQGLFYDDSHTVFGVGFFAKDPSDKKGHLHIIAPRGSDWLKTVTTFIQTVSSKMPEPLSSVYIRHLNPEQYTQMLEAGYESIDHDPWDVVAPSEDETFNHRYIALTDIVELQADSSLLVKTLVSDDSRDFKRKTKMAYNRFANFLKRNELEYVLETYTVADHSDIAKSMIIEHFKSLKNAVGSTPEDYFNLISLVPDYLHNEFCGFIGFLVGKGKKIPVTLFMGEKIDAQTMALYVTFALRNDTRICKDFDTMGYSAISQYSYIRVFEQLLKRGITHVDLGGSEVEDLNNFKRQLGAQEKKTYWVVKAI